MKLFTLIPKVKVSLVDLFSHPKLKDYLLGLIIFFAPTQLGLHFWPDSALVYGVRVDYLAPTIYFFDLLILAYLFLNAPRIIHNTKYIIHTLPLLLTNLLYSQNPLAALSWSFHFLLYLSFLAIAFPRTLLNRNSWLQAKKGSAAAERRVLPVILMLSMFFQLSLATAQVVLGHSVGGLMYYLGERTVSVGQPAVALATFMGHIVLRAYGTFSHPNILAGWLVITCLITLRLVGLQLPNSINQRVVRGSDLLRKSWLSAKMFSRALARPGRTLLVPAVIVLTTLGLFLTQSRSAALAFFGLVIPFTILKSLRVRLLYFAGLCVTASLVTGVFSRPIDLSLTERQSLQALSLQTTRTFPIFGTGTQASISTYPIVFPNSRLLQPDHNSFTLLLSWFGIFGVIAFIYALRSQLENWRIYALRILVLLPLLLLDHYLLTSPQGLFIVCLYFVVAVNYSHAQKNL